MKIERINDNKIRVEINSEDVRIWNVNIKKLTDNTPEAQNLFWHAIKKAEREFAFNVGSSRLLVEAIPLRNDGFVMIISKVVSENEVVDIIANNASLKMKHAEIKVKKVTRSAETYAVYKFKNFDDMCNAASEISQIFIGKSMVYKCSDEFYMKLEPIDVFGFSEINNKISEFADRCRNASVTTGFLAEYGEVFIPFDAVENLTYYFS